MKFTTSGFEVTVIDFGLAKQSGRYLGLQGPWNQNMHLPPEFFQKHNLGRCSTFSDAYSIGKLLLEIS